MSEASEALKTSARDPVEVKILDQHRGIRDAAALTHRTIAASRRSALFPADEASGALGADRSSSYILERGPLADAGSSTQTRRVGTSEESDPLGRTGFNGRSLAVIPFPRPARYRESYRVLQQWEGTVTDVDDDRFGARLVDRTRSGQGEERAVFSKDEVQTGDLGLLEVGSVFYWSIGYRLERGTRELSSVIRFRRIPVWTRPELENLRKGSEFEEFFRDE